MAKNVNFVFGNNRWQAGINKVERDKVYGWVEESVTDDKGSPCVIANMLEDGSTMILSGGTAIRTIGVETGAEVDKKALKPLLPDGQEAHLLPSVFDEDVILKSATMTDLFNLEVASVYQLVFDKEEQKKNLADALNNANLFRFTFNYRADYETNDAIMLSGQNEVFILIGRLLDFPWMENKLIQVAEDSENTETGDDDFDFGML